MDKFVQRTKRSHTTVRSAGARNENNEVPPSVPSDISSNANDGPVQPSLHAYPVSHITGDKEGVTRSFKADWFTNYPWIEYSQSNNSVYCFACRHFAISSNVENRFTVAGYQNWKKACGMSGKFSKHARADYHLDAMVAWSNFNTMERNESSVAQMVSDGYAEKVRRNRQFIKTLGEVILLTCTQKIAQRGHDESDSSSNPGNVIRLLELIGRHDDIVLEHLRDSKRNAKYTSPDIQNEVISLMAGMVKEEITNEVKNAKYFSVIVDETKDISKQEQLSLLLRYSYKGQICESFLEFTPASSLDAESLTGYILDILGKHQLDYQSNLVGQGYDGASVMSGKNTGVQSRIKEKAPFAYYVHCHAHRLNLVLVDVTSRIPDASKFFSLLEKLYVFFSHTYAHSKWVEVQRELYPTEKPREIKRLSETRWSCRADACTVINDRLPALSRVLEEMAQGNDADRAVEARGLLGQINGKFLAHLMIFSCLLSKINMLSKMLQSSSIDLGAAVDLIGALVNDFEEMRLKPDYFDDVWRKIELTSEDNGLDVSDCVPSKRRRRIPMHLQSSVLLEALPGGPSNTEDGRNAKEEMRISLFNVVVDNFLAEMKRRFGSSACAIMRSIPSLTPTSDKFLNYDQMQGIIAAYGGNNVDIQHEIHSCRRVIQRRKEQNEAVPESLQDFSQFLEPFHEAFPELCRLAKIAIVIPVSSAGAERSFSAMKLIKSRVRNAMGNARLSNLSLLAIESRRGVDLDVFVDKFAGVHKNRRISLK